MGIIAIMIILAVLLARAHLKHSEKMDRQTARDEAWLEAFYG